ncbi:hypothetical protein ACH47Z_40495 [Streptomyces sp. NPDC020192]|uniref:hypothetical protein n=1 Tax=Streptomyces sp. NPDC020192 TaxID=3365066 RepID=UPI0037A2253F
MNTLRAYAGRRSIVIVSVTAALLGTLSGCSDHKEKRQYAIPYSLCGIPVDSDTLAPFMPPGRKISVRQDLPDGFAARCEVRVDSRLAVQASQEWLSGPNTAYFVGGQANSKLGHQAEDGRFLYSGWEAFGETRSCKSEKLLGNHLFTAFQMHSSNHQDTDAMKQLITAYTNAVEKTDTCKQGLPFKSQP